MTDAALMPLSEIQGTRYAKILNYPAAGDAELDGRLRELRGIGVTAIRFSGPSKIEGIDILGKGCVGLVAEAILQGKPVALKIRRSDANRPSMYEEARLLRLANSVSVGPMLITATRNYLVMEVFSGLPLFKWAAGPRSTNSLRLVLSRLLDSCFRLDVIGLDHGEISHAPKNVLVGKNQRTCIVDFESASMVRRVANVTSLMQYFLFGSISKTLRISRIIPHRRDVIHALSSYKYEGTLQRYRSLLETLGLKDYYEPAAVSAKGGAVV